MDEPLSDLLSKVAVHLGEPGEIREFGVSRIIHLPSSGRNFEIGINENSLWINHDLVWDQIPESVEIAYAPNDSYTRASLLSEKVDCFQTGDQAFDSVFMILGDPEASTPFSKTLSPAARQTFLEYSDMKVSIQHFEIMTGRTSPIEKRLHAHSSLQFDSSSSEGSALLLQSPAQVSKYASRLKDFVFALENCH